MLRGDGDKVFMKDMIKRGHFFLDKTFRLSCTI